MNDERLKEEFFAMEIPDMKEDIMKAAKRENSEHPRRRMKPAAVIVMAAMIALLGITVGAAAGGMLKLNSGGRIRIKNEDGVIVNPTGFHLDEEVDVPLSEKALENIAPYVFTPGEEAALYETAVQEEMETFLDMPLYLPDAIADGASLYRLWAVGADGAAVSIELQVVAEDERDASMNVYLRGSAAVIGTAGEPVMGEYALPDGTPVSVAVADSREGGMVGHALYKLNDAVYHLRVYGADHDEVIERIEAVLETVG